MLSSMLAVAVAASQSPQRAVECQIIDALFIQETANLPKIDPKYVRPPGHIDQLRPRNGFKGIVLFIPTLAVSLDVPEKAAKELVSVVLLAKNWGWKPDCVWSTTPTGMANAFTRPVMSSDNRLAAFEWDTGIDDPPGNLGKVCLAYRPEQSWKISCSISWER